MSEVVEMHRSRFIDLIRRAGWFAPIVVTAFLYLQVGDHQYIDFDDMYYTYENPMVVQGLTIDGLRWAFTESYFANYHPLTWISHMADFQFLGNNPGSFALENATIHAVNSLLIALLLARLFGSQGIGIAAGVVFAAHPQLVEAVAWISQRKTLLSTMFALGSIHLYLSSLRHNATSVHVPRYTLAVLLYILSLLSKGMYVTLPAILIILEFVARSRTVIGAKVGENGPALLFDRRHIIQLAYRCVPFTILAFAFAAVTFWAQAGYGAVQSAETLPLTTRLATALVGVTTYLRQFVFPSGFSIYYPRPDSVNAVVLASSALTFVGISWIAFYIRKSVGLAPLLGWMLFLAMILPVVGLVQVGDQARADRYMYGPILGFLIAIAAIAESTAKHLRSRSLKTLGAATLIAWLLITGALAFRQVSHWFSSYTIGMTSEANVGPAPQLVGLQATALIRAHKFKTAIPLYRKVLASTPDHLSTLNNLAFAELKVGNTEEAIALCKQHIELAPEIGSAYANLALAYAQSGRPEEARQVMDAAANRKMLSLSSLRTFATVRMMLDRDTLSPSPTDRLP